MSNDIQKADQITYHFYTKLVLVVNSARSTAEPKLQSKVDKWFNLETPDSDLFKEHVRVYRSISLLASAHSAPTPSSSSSSSSSRPLGNPPPFEIQVVLCVPELSPNQALVYLAPDSSHIRVEPTPKYILLETWTIVFNTSPHTTTSSQATTSTTTSTSEGDQLDVAPSTIYKHAIPLFRSVYSLLRILPAWKLYKKLRRRMGGAVAGNFGIQLMLAEMNPPEDILAFHVPPSRAYPAIPTDTHTFQSISHPSGTFGLTTTYLTLPNFQIDSLESLLSTRFLSLDIDEGPDFTPTLVKNQQQGHQRTSTTSVSGSPGSLAVRTSLPMSPPTNTTKIADRFVLPASSSRPPSLSSSPRTGPLALPTIPAGVAAPGTSAGAASSGSGNSGSGVNSIGAPSMAGNRTMPVGSNSGISVGSSSNWSKEEHPRPPSSLAARLRKESMGRGGDLPSSPLPLPLPIRRPNINPVHPFKSSTLSSGSTHSGSPSSRLSALPSGVAGVGGGISGSPLSSLGIPLPFLPSAGANQSNAAFPTLPTLPSRSSQTSPTSSRFPPSPITSTSTRPSPPFAPGSLGDRSAEDGSPGNRASTGNITGLPTRKRYSSSFGHRYAASAGGGSEGSGSVGSTGPGAEKEKGTPERMAPTEMLSAGVGSSGGGEKEKHPYLSRNTYDDDISDFVQDIDARKPLRGYTYDHDRDPSMPGPVPGQRMPLPMTMTDRALERDSYASREPRPSIGFRGFSSTSIEDYRTGEREEVAESSSSGSNRPMAGDRQPLASVPGGGPGTRLSDVIEVSTAGSGSNTGASTAPTSPTTTRSNTNTGPMLASQGEVDERLRQMNQAFLVSLEGLGSGSRRDRNRKSLGVGTASGGDEVENGDQQGNGQIESLRSGPSQGTVSRATGQSQSQRSRVSSLGVEFMRNNTGTGRDTLGYPNRGAHPLNEASSGSGSTSVSSVAGSGSAGQIQMQGSEEVIGRMEMPRSSSRR